MVPLLHRVSPRLRSTPTSILRLAAADMRPRFSSSAAAPASASASASAAAPQADDYEEIKKHINPGISRISSQVIKSAQGVYITMTDGRRFLDFTSGIAVTSTGHCHPKVVQAVSDQVQKLIHGQVNIAYHEPMLKLIKRLLPIVPPGLDSFFFWNSGSEAVEAAMKLARQATGKSNFIAFQGGYHGRTFGAMSVTSSKNIYMVGYGPFVPGVFTTPFPYSSQLPKGLSQQDMSDYCLEQFERLLLQQSAASDTAAAILEPILGEGGYVVPPPDFLPRLKQICQKNGILLIADEVQSGFGRTGKMFAVDHFGVVPDILIIAKGIASGFPLSGIVASRELTKNQPPGSMGGTYSGNVVSCAAALATLDVFEEEKILENTIARGKQLRDGLLRLAERYPVKEVRGLGLMLSMEFKSGVPAGTASRITKALADDGMFLLTCGSFETLRFAPALTINEKEVNEGLQFLDRALAKVLG